MNNWFSAEVEVRRRQDEAAAKGSRYHTLEPFLQQPQSLRRYQRLLVHLGAQLESWGCRLQARYNAIAVSAEGSYRPPERIANHHRTEPC